MIDEIMFDPQTAIAASLFNLNSSLKRPWGSLDDQFPWVILNVKDPACFRTNIFNGPDFEAAVRAVITEDNNG
jgi:hypothetical protein